MKTTNDQDGAIAAELAVIAPVLLVLMLLVVYGGRASLADGRVETAAARASRAASLTATPTQARDVALDVALDNLAAAGLVCVTPGVSTDTSQFARAGTVTVTVACPVSNADLALVAVPGVRTAVASSTAVIDTYRGGG